MTRRNIVTELLDSDLSNAQCARQCLLRADQISGRDGPLPSVDRPELAAAAQTFALLAIADALRSTSTGDSVADLLTASSGNGLADVLSLLA